MKKILAALFVFVLHVNAFAIDKPGSHYCRPDTTTISCQLELALVCGQGYIDGCLSGSTRVHKCVLRNEGPACNLEIQILCPKGFRDGCEIGRTTRHQCVPVIGPRCDSGEEFVCPEGFQDTCAAD